MAVRSPSNTTNTAGKINTLLVHCTSFQLQYEKKKNSNHATVILVNQISASWFVNVMISNKLAGISEKQKCVEFVCYLACVPCIF